ncbi:MAG: DUF6261 family protein, partial [Bacteroidales bacterium]|nr:DUF6261 family protein [Bacteroidales bacterium]
MQNILKLQSLDTHKLSIPDLGGLINETINASIKVKSSLNGLSVAALDVLVNADGAFRENLVMDKTSPLTKLIADLDKKRDNDFWEIRRTSKTAAKSSIEDKAEAGKLLESFLKPYHNLAKEPLMSETSTINHLHTQFDSNPALHNAADTLQLTDIFTNLWNVNEQLANLWNERATIEAERNGTSPSSLRNPLEKAYHNYCAIILQSVELQPNEALQTLFSVMNEIRIKYAKSLPVRINSGNIFVAPIPVQKYTGKNITPITRVLVRKENEEFTELRFTVDYFFTYKNNIEIGEAQIIIHG